MRRLTICSAAAFCLGLFILSRVVAQSTPTPSTTEAENRLAVADQTQLLGAETPEFAANSNLHTADLKRKTSGKLLVSGVETGLGSASFAEIARPEFADLPGKLRAAKDSFQPVAKADVLARQVAVESAMRRLDRYLKNSGEVGDGWRKYLQFAALQTELQKDLDAQPRALRNLSARFSDGSPGLEFAQFAAVRTSINSYIDTLTAFQNSEAKAQYDKDLDTLANNLEAVAFRRGKVDRRPVGEVLNRVAASGQVPNLVSAVQQQLAQPNLLVKASSGIVGGGIDDDVNEETPVKDVILGTQINGNGHTTGHIKSALIPNKDRAIVEIQLTGQTNAKTVGHNGPVTIFSHSATALDAHKRINLAEQEFTGDPSSANCCTKSCIDCLSICGGFIIQHIATKRVYANKACGEAIAAQHAEVRLENRMNSRTADLLANANRSFDERFRDPLTRLGAYPQFLRFSTTSDWLSVVGLQARANELGASTPPPEAAANAQLSIRLHETLVDNFAAALAPGRTARSLAYRHMMRDLLGEPYQRGEFDDFVLCLAETGAPLDHRDQLLVVKYDQFKSLMKDRFAVDVTEAEFQALTRAMHAGTLSQQQFDKYLAGLTKEPPKYDDVVRLLGDFKRGDVQVNYSGMTFADLDPISAKFEGGKFRLTLRIKSTTQPKLDNEGQRIVNPYPAEIFVTYKLAMRDGKVIATRVDNEYGVKALPLAEKDESNLSLREKTRRSTLLTKTLPRRFFGGGEATDRDDEDISAEPIFPPEKESTGLTLRGRWKRLGELPWAQIAAEDGWLALGWAMPEAKGTTE
jgi:hypothetical protein